MWVCQCFAVTDAQIAALVREGARTTEDIAAACGAGSSCANCLPTIRDLLRETVAAQPVSHRTSCARLSRAAGDDLHGTASASPRWILLEEPGTGGCDAVLEQRVPVAVAVRLKAVSRELQARVVLIRRHGRYTPHGRRCYAVSSEPDAAWAEYHTLDRLEDVLDIDWTPLGEGKSVGGRVLPHPLYLVCTNGRHDPCCAEFGRPVANALQEQHAERVWECSHLGGDRFAANMVVLPEGLYFGRVEPSSASSIVEAYESGRIDLAHYRGRSCFPVPVQVAEYHARAASGLAGVHDLRVVEVVNAEPGRIRCTFRDRGGRLLVVLVAPGRVPVDRPLTCRSSDSRTLMRFDLVSVTEQAS